MPRNITELDQNDIAQAITAWVDQGCKVWETDAQRRVRFTIDEGDPGHYADRGRTISARVRSGSDT